MMKLTRLVMERSMTTKTRNLSYNKKSNGVLIPPHYLWLKQPLYQLGVAASHRRRLQ